ncbi:MAG: hypothetical protein J7L41_03410, partial [Synergistetes bacterium]|nr:hypothetical protein [Synergistota bacterium]
MHRKAIVRWLLASGIGALVAALLVYLFISEGLLTFLNVQQIVSLSVLISIIFGTITVWELRTPIAMGGIVLLVLFKILTVEAMIEHMDLNLIIFLIGMMVVVEYVDRSGFFSWLTVKILNLSGFKPCHFLSMFIIFTVFMGAIVDEVTTILFMMAVVLTVCKEFDEDPVFYAIVMIFAVNIGSSMTAVGNPIGVFIALNAHPRLTFMDFIRNAAPLRLVNAAILVFAAIFLFRRRLSAFREKIVRSFRSKMGQERIRTEMELTEAELEEAHWDEWKKVRNRKHFYIAVWVLALLMLTLSLHSYIEHMFGFSSDTILIVAPIFFAGVVLFSAGGEEAREILEKGVDWWTLLYFLFLLPAIASLEYTGITHRLSVYISGILKYGAFATILFMLVFSAIMSGWVDNFPVIAAITPIVQYMIKTGMPNGELLWWSLLFGGCYGGNWTMIGSTANIVALGVLEREKGIKITFFEWFKKGSII